MTTKVAARVMHHFDASAERVYDAWLEPEKIRVWMEAALIEWGVSGELRRIEVDARVGGRFFFSDMREAGEAKHPGTYLELDRPIGSYSLGSSVRRRRTIRQLLRLRSSLMATGVLRRSCTRCRLSGLPTWRR